MSVNRWRLLSVLGLVLVMAFGATSVFGSSGEGSGNGRAGDVVPDSYVVILQDGASADAVAKDHGVVLHGPLADGQDFLGRLDSQPGEEGWLRPALFSSLSLRSG